MVYWVNRSDNKAVTKEKIEPVTNKMATNKPNGGLWCDRDGVYGWERYCRQTEYMNRQLGQTAKIVVSDSARVLKIDSKESFDEFATKYKRSPEELPNAIKHTNRINFEKAAKDYDIIEFRAAENKEVLDAYSYCVCDSAFIMNKNVIVGIDNDRYTPARVDDFLYDLDYLHIDRFSHDDSILNPQVEVVDNNYSQLIDNDEKVPNNETITDESVEELLSNLTFKGNYVDFSDEYYSEHDL